MIGLIANIFLTLIRIMVLYVTDAPREAKAKLRICGLHFSEEMVLPSGPRRRLIDNAMPTLHLPNVNIAEDNASTNVTETGAIAALQASEDVGCNSMFEPDNCSEGQKVINVILNRPENVRQIRGKIRRYQKALYKKKSRIKKLKKQKAANTTWDNITAEMTGVQKTFFEMISQNFHHAPQVC